MIADDLATPGARASAAMVLTLFSQNILVLPPEGKLILAWDCFSGLFWGYGKNIRI